MDERSQRFDEVYSAWHERRSKGESAVRLKRILPRDYRDVWQNGDQQGRVTVLFFIRDTLLPDAEDIILSSIRSRSDLLIGFALAILAKYLRKGQLQPSRELVSELVRILRDGQEQHRRSAIHALGQADLGGMDSLIRSLADADPSPDVRREANVILVSRSDLPAKAALFADIRSIQNSLVLLTTSGWRQTR